MKAKIFTTLGLIGMVAIVIWLQSSRRLPNDLMIEERFRLNRTAFDQLVEMFTTDNQEMRIEVHGGYWYASATSEGVSNKRKAEYRNLLRQIGASSIGGSRNSKSTSIAGIGFEIRQSAWLPETPIKSVLYSTEPLHVPQTSTETGDFQFRPDAQVHKVCREIDVN